MEVGVPAGYAFFDVSRVVRHWIDADVFEHDHRSAALDDAEEDVVRLGPLKRDVEPETVAIKRQRGRDILHDEEGRNPGNFWFGHVTFHRLSSIRYRGRLRTRRAGRARFFACLANFAASSFKALILSIPCVSDCPSVVSCEVSLQYEGRVRVQADMRAVLSSVQRS